MIYFRNKTVCSGTAARPEQTLRRPSSDRDYLYFQAERGGASVRFTVPSSFNARLEYSTDGVSWSEWVPDVQGVYDVFPTITLQRRGDFVFLRAVSENRFAASDSLFAYFSNSPKRIVCGGNIMSLLDGSVSSLAIKDKYTFYRLFCNCTSLTSAPVLPAERLSAYCYHSMFYGCTSLESAPSLPAGTLATACYASMFYGCTSLTEGADMQNARTLASQCCQYMYQNCTSLSAAWTPDVTSWSTSYFSSWLSNVAPVGTLYRPSGLDMTSYVGASGIPSGWVASAPTKTVTFSAVGDGSQPFSYTPAGGLAVQVADWQSSQATLAESQSVTVAAPGQMLVVLSDGKAVGFGSSVTVGYGSLTNGGVVECTCVDVSECLRFTAGTAESTVGMTHAGTNQSSTQPVLYKSEDNGVSWSVWDGTAVTLSSVGDSMLVAGLNGNGISSSYSDYSKFVMTGSVSASGNLHYILDFGTRVFVTQYCFANLFSGCTGLTSAPVLPATTLAAICYYKMFYGCTGLTSAPVLPATTLAANCYESMFQGCSNLASAPVLPATTLAGYCYYNMFYGCGKLKTAPELPATTLADSCYRAMFYDCQKITTAPELPAMALASDCYAYMFYFCRALTKAPEIPATTLKYECYRGMFQGCTSLTTAPELPAETLAENCYYAMFSTCTSLKYVKVWATEWNTTYANGWLYNVASSGTLEKRHGVSIPTNSTSGVPTGWTAYDYDGPLTFTANTAGSTIGMTHYGTNQSSTKPVIYTSTDGGQNWSQWDYSTITLTNVGDTVMMYGNNPNGISSSASTLSSFTMTGSVSASGDCTTLVAQGGSSSINASYCFCKLFQNCTNLTTTPELPATTLAGNCYQLMFLGCTSLTTAPELPATTLAIRCYQSMFQNCTNLTTTPELPATTLAENCYSYMFSGCTSLNYIKVGATSWNTSYANKWVSDVSSTGDFYKPDGTTIPSGTSGIPNNWTVHNT